MRKFVFVAGVALAFVTSCNMENPLLTESKLPYGAPQFDKIRNEHYMPAFEQGIAEAKAEIDAITDNPEAPTFENTVEAMEYAGQTLSADDLKSTGQMDEMPKLTIKEDGTCTFSFMGEDGEGTVSAGEGGQYDIQDDSDQTLTFEIKDGKLRLDYSEMSMVMIFEQTK